MTGLVATSFAAIAGGVNATIAEDTAPAVDVVRHDVSKEIAAPVACGEADVSIDDGGLIAAAYDSSATASCYYAGCGGVI